MVLEHVFAALEFHKQQQWLFINIEQPLHIKMQLLPRQYGSNLQFAK